MYEMPTEVCNRCGKPGPDCAHCGELISFCRSAYLYEGAAGAAVRRHKYERFYALGEELGRLTASRVERYPQLYQADLVVPVPIHSSRRRHRTFNQSELIAAPIAGSIGAPLIPNALVRWKKTPSQVRSTVAQREANVAGAFRVPDATHVSGKRVLLVDDVYTSGSTLRECARTLLDAGARAVLAITVCRE